MPKKKEVNKMSAERFVIAGGNTTLLIKDNRKLEKIKIAQDAINNDQAEQVGFTAIINGVPTLSMAGNELCVNATLAYASQLGGMGSLKASGIEGDVQYETLEGGIIQATFDLPFSRPKEDLVLFGDIGYKVGISIMPESTLWNLAGQYKKPAFGLTRIDRSGAINPIVYVAAIRTCVLETACGSGSIATSIVTGESEIRQPTGELIRVSRAGERFTVSAEVRKLGERSTARQKVLV